MLLKPTESKSLKLAPTFSMEIIALYEVGFFCPSLHGHVYTGKRSDQGRPTVMGSDVKIESLLPAKIFSASFTHESLLFT